MGKILTAAQAVARIQNGDTVMVGGFFSAGAPNELVQALLDQGTKDLHVIANDAQHDKCALYDLIASERLCSLTTSHMGRNPVAGQLMLEGKLEVRLFPQGTLCEKIRHGGAGLGGFLTPTGLGSVVEEGKQILEIDGKRYILELPLHANVALIAAHTADELGNLMFQGSTRNTNVVMATAADFVIAQVEHIVPAGEIDPNHVHVPCIFVDAIVQGEVVSHE